MAAPGLDRVRVSSEVELAVTDFGGQGPLVLLHHASGFCAQTWRAVALQVRGARLVAFDARGHGDSTAPAGHAAYDWGVLASDLRLLVHELLSRTGRRSVDLAVGHSIGGTVSLAAAADEPALFGRILALDPVIAPPGADPMGRRGNPLAVGARKRRAVFDSRAAAAAQWRDKPFFASWSSAVFEDYLQGGLRDRPDGQVELKCDPETEAILFETSATVDCFALAPRVAVPVLLQWAARGNFPRERYERLAEALPDATVETVETGHLVPMERPDLVAATIQRLLR